MTHSQSTLKQFSLNFGKLPSVHFHAFRGSESFGAFRG